MTPIQGRKYGLLEGGTGSFTNTPGGPDHIDLSDMWLLDLTAMANHTAPIVWTNVTGTGVQKLLGRF